MGTHKDRNEDQYLSDFAHDDEADIDENFDIPQHGRRARQTIEDRLERKRLKEELEDELDDEFDWDDLD